MPRAAAAQVETVATPRDQHQGAVWGDAWFGVSPHLVDAYNCRRKPGRIALSPLSWSDTKLGDKLHKAGGAILRADSSRQVVSRYVGDSLRTPRPRAHP